MGFSERINDKVELVAIEHLKGTYCELTETFNVLSPIEYRPRADIPVAEAIVKIVTGQMLSTKAASVIYNRIKSTSDKHGYSGSWKLSAEKLQTLGLSHRKAIAIKDFGKKYDSDPELFESWRKISHEELKPLVCSHWGLSSWSVDILAIFYFGFLDVFPINDGTIKRAVTYLEKNYYSDRVFDYNLAKPYRTYLSLFLWKLMDTDLIKGQD